MGETACKVTDAARRTRSFRASSCMAAFCASRHGQSGGVTVSRAAQGMVVAVRAAAAVRQLEVGFWLLHVESVCSAREPDALDL